MGEQLNESIDSILSYHAASGIVSTGGQRQGQRSIYAQLYRDHFKAHLQGHLLSFEELHRQHCGDTIEASEFMHAYQWLSQQSPVLRGVLSVLVASILGKKDLFTRSRNERHEHG
jgi:hypothetical protein